MLLRLHFRVTSTSATSRVARASHPAFSATGRRPAVLACALFGAAAAAVLTLQPVSASAATGAGYRLSGVVAVGDEHLGFLEIPAGQKVLIRTGGEVPGGGRVIAFDGQTVRIAFPDRTIELVLEGSGAAGGYTPTTDIVTAQEDNDRIHVRTVAAEPLRTALQQSPGNAASTAAAPIQRRGRTDAGAEVAQRFTALLNLPAGSRVLSVNEQAIVSAADAVAMVNDTLAGGMPARLNITNAAGSDQRVYLLPVRD